MAQNSLEFRIARELSNFYWNGFLNFSTSKNSFDLYIYERFSEMVVKTDRVFVRDDNDFRFKLYKSINRRFKTVFVINSVSFADDKLSGLSKASTNEILTGVKFYPFEKFGFSFLGGYKIDNQMGQKDKGWAYKVSSDTAELLISNYHLKTSLNYSEDFITSRKNIVSALNLALWRKFAPEVESKVEFLVKRIKRDFYFYADSSLQKIYNVNFNLEGRDEKTISGLTILGYPLSNNFTFNVNLMISGRNIDKRIRHKTSSLYDSKIREFNLSTGVDLSYETRRLKLRFGINYSERDEIHTPQRHELITESVFFRIKQNEEQKNNKSLRRIANGAISFDFSERLTLGGMFYVSLFRYDTPSSLNDDDRDELLQIFRIFLRAKLSNEIQIELPLDLNNQHLVYIFSTRSINNNWNRILRLAPTVVFESEDVRNKASFSVLANYIVYDFESIASTVKSYVFRQFYLNDSILFPIFGKLNFEGNFQLTFSESGRLKWKEFKEKPALFISVGEYSFRLNYSLNRATRFSVGYRFFEQKTYKFVGLDKVLDSRVTATGPTSRVEFEGSGFKLSFEGWVEKLSFGEKVNNLPNLNLNLTINL